MKRAAVLGAALGLAACNTQPATPPGPRIPNITIAMLDKDPSLYPKYQPLCISLNASSTLTKLEDLRCVSLTAQARLYLTMHDLKRWPGK
ncbi:MAG: hypothetical protein ABIQ66_09635 [Novosphingobium sp.]